LAPRWSSPTKAEGATREAWRCRGQMHRRGASRRSSRQGKTTCLSGSGSGRTYSTASSQGLPSPATL